MNWFFYQLPAMAGGRWLGWGVIAALGCTYAAASYLVGVMLFVAPRRKALVAVSASAAMTMVLTCVRVELEYGEATRLLIGNSLVHDPSQHARLVAESVSRLIGTLTRIPLLLVPIVLLVAIALFWRRQHTWQRDLAAVAALLFAVTLGSAYNAQRVFLVGFHCHGDCLYERLARSVDAIHWGKVHLTCAAALCGAWLIGVARKRWPRGKSSDSLSLTGCLLLILGTFAVLSMSGRRHDTEHPIPRDPSNLMPCLARLPSVPEAAPDCAAFDAPYFEVTPDGAQMDGERVSTPEDVRTLLDNKRKLWLELNPEKVFPGAVVLVVRRQARARDLVPWLVAARGAGFTKVGAYVQAPTLALVTETIGVLHKHHCCLAPFSLDDAAGIPLTHFEDWDALVRATHGSALHVSLR
jgi:hypothetical protein